MSFTVKLIVFDLDGTLVDSLPELAAAANYALRRLGLPEYPLAEHRRMIGQGEKAFVRRFLGPEQEHLFEEALVLYLEYYSQNLGTRAQVYPGVPATLSRLSALPLAVLSNKRTDLCQKLLETLGLAGFFQAIRGGDSYASRKPSPEGLQALMTELGGEPETTLMVGDKPEDILTGRQAGARTAALTYGYGDREALKAARPDHLVAAFPEIAELVGL